MREKILAGAFVALSPLFFVDSASAGELVEFLSTQHGVSVTNLPDNAISAKIGACTAVIQSQEAGAVKIFTFLGDDVLENPNTGLTSQQLLQIKHELGDAKMTDAALMSKLEHTKSDIAQKIIELLKESSKCNVKAPLTS